MLKNQELGQAIKEALAQNGYSQAEAARKFNVRPPSITGWIQTGRISKENFEILKNWCSKTPLSHWGLGESISRAAATIKNEVHVLSDHEKELLDSFRSLKLQKHRYQVLGIIKDFLDSESVQHIKSGDHSTSSRVRKAA